MCINVFFSAVLLEFVPDPVQPEVEPVVGVGPGQATFTQYTVAGTLRVPAQYLLCKRNW